jgi:hypothetical protein
MSHDVETIKTQICVCDTSHQWLADKTSSSSVMVLKSLHFYTNGLLKEARTTQYRPWCLPGALATTAVRRLFLEADRLDEHFAQATTVWDHGFHVNKDISHTSADVD